MANSNQSRKALQGLVDVICEGKRGIYRKLEKEAHLGQKSIKRI